MEDVGVDHGGFDVLMAEELLLGVDAVAGFEQPVGEGLLGADLIEQLDGLGSICEVFGKLVYFIMKFVLPGTAVGLPAWLARILPLFRSQRNIIRKTSVFANRGGVLDGIAIQFL